MDPSLKKFQAETRAWLTANCPESMRQPVKDLHELYWGGRKSSFSGDDQRIWFERMMEKGWIAAHWPREYGGGGLTQAEYHILQKEMQRLGCRPPLMSFGISMLGPALLRYGKEEQKKEHLPKIVRGEIRWCQGYSEPNAGSDLAALQTKAVREGNYYKVTGQKIWTSYADLSDWIFCLVRTDPEAPKHQGISFLLLDMATPGISTRPIKLISGKSPFCETFFDEVKVPITNLVGQENKGWEIAKHLLSHEREMIGGMDKTETDMPLHAFATQRLPLNNGRLAHAALRSAIAGVELDFLAYDLTIKRVKEEAKAGQGHVAQASFFKFFGTELNKKRWEIMMDLFGSDGLGWEGEEYEEGAIARLWLRSKGNSIEGGTSEIQLNIMAKHLLGLPGQ